MFVEIVTDEDRQLFRQLVANVPTILENTGVSARRQRQLAVRRDVHIKPYCFHPVVCTCCFLVSDKYPKRCLCDINVDIVFTSCKSDTYLFGMVHRTPFTCTLLLNRSKKVYKDPNYLDLMRYINKSAIDTLYTNADSPVVTYSVNPVITTCPSALFLKTVRLTRLIDILEKWTIGNTPKTGSCVSFWWEDFDVPDDYKIPDNWEYWIKVAEKLKLIKYTSLDTLAMLKLPKYGTIGTICHYDNARAWFYWMSKLGLDRKVLQKEL